MPASQDATKETYLVFMGTGRQGRATIQALQDKGVTSIVATSRNPESSSSKKLMETYEAIQKVLPVNLNDLESVVKAIQGSNASRIWFTTDWYAIPNPKTREKEFLTGKAVVDGILAALDNTDATKIKHVVYSSVGDADNVPETVEHFWSKADVEAYMKQSFSTTQVTWSIIRPVAFFDNLDDPGNYNPLSRGSVKFLAAADCRTKFIATEDIGKGAAALLMDPGRYASKTIEAAGGAHTGHELAAALTQVSGVQCTYKIAVPRFILKWFMTDLYHMTEWFESDGYTADIDAFKKIVPDAMDATAWFASKGRWADGTKFGQEAPHQGALSKVALVVVPLVAVAGAYLVVKRK